MTTDTAITIAGLRAKLGALIDHLETANQSRVNFSCGLSKMEAHAAGVEAERDALAAQLAEARAALAATPKVCAIHSYALEGPCMTCGAPWPGAEKALRQERVEGMEKMRRISADVDAADQRVRTLDAALTAERETSRGLVAQVDTWRDTWARVETIVDEAFGPFPVWPVYDTICAMERGIHDGIRAAQELAAIRDLVAPGNPQGTVVDAVRARLTHVRADAELERDAAIARAEKAEAEAYTLRSAAEENRGALVGTDGIDHGEQCPPIDISDRNGIRAVLARLEVSLVAPVDPEVVARRYHDHKESPVPEWPYAADHDINSPIGADHEQARLRATAAMRATLTAAGIPVTPEVGK